MRRPASRAVAALTLGAVVLVGCSDDPEPSGAPSAGSSSPASSRASSPASTPASTPASQPASPSTATSSGPPTVIGTVARGLATPWGIGFLPDGDAIVTERDTRKVLRIERTTHDVRTVGTISAAVPLGDSGGEAGLLGVAVSPDFARDHLLYFYLSTASDNRIVRARLDGRRLGPTRVILGGIPHGFIHDGGRLAFGPDGYLYASTGETGERDLAQDTSSLGGKILRITTDGAPAPGNPFDSPVWSYGHRNVQGLAFDADGRLWASEFGDKTFDELNLIRKGHDYGWPEVEGTGGSGRYTDPQVTWDTDQASPSGLALLGGHLWLGALRGERLWRVDVDGAEASGPKSFFVGRYGRMRTVVAAPDGTLWVTTSNRDGRGDPRAGDDRILVVRP